ncbi:MFS transporter [Devosia aquimaris]|uniref:MFS transporter n=1 Tax=Devosia aquimaris TaxID=2866214 RepID=UPI001CD09B37|nr:MFS transporter [Devosia sp. CJK-A8-3]
MSLPRPFLALSAATVLATTGTRFSAIAVPWLVLETTGDPVLTGLAGLAEMLPYVLAKALGGPLIDRLGPRRMAITCDLLSTMAVAVVPLLYWAGLLSIWILLPALALIGVLRAPADASKQAMVPAVAALGHMPLERVTGVVGAADRLAGTLGAASAGALIGLLGSGAALIANATAFLLSALVLSMGVPRTNAAVAADATAEPVVPIGYIGQFAAGWHVLRSDAVLMGLVLMIAVTNLFDQAYSMVLLPVWVRAAGLDVTWVGIFLATFSASAIAGSTLAAIYGARLPRLLLYTLGFLCAGPLALGSFALNLPLPAIIAILLLGGLAAGFLNPIISAILLERTPAPMVGRVIALTGALTWSLIPFGGLYAGLLVNNVGILPALGVTATLYLCATLLPLAIPSFRQMGQARAGATS